MKVTSKNVSALKVVEALNHLNERQGACNRGRDGLPLRAGGKVQATTISQSAGAGTKAPSVTFINEPLLFPVMCERPRHLSSIVVHVAGGAGGPTDLCSVDVFRVMCLYEYLVFIDVLLFYCYFCGISTMVNFVYL